MNSAALGRALGAAVVALEAVGGGQVNRAARVRLADGRTAFVKHRPGAPPDAWDAEAADLDWLRVPGGPRIPRVLARRDGPDGFLALEWLPPSPPAPDHDERLGRALAALHGAGAPVWGLHRDNYIGPLPQPNGPCATWAEFYAERRVLPLVRAAHDRGLLDAPDLARAERLAARLPELAGPEEPPARLHGDLWAGNAHPGPGGEPVLVDPAAYGGHRETDLAMMDLFGGFGPRVAAAYEEASPISAGRSGRAALHQLYPLLVHALLFGGGYRGAVRRTLTAYA